MITVRSCSGELVSMAINAKVINIRSYLIEFIEFIEDVELHIFCLCASLTCECVSTPEAINNY